MSLRYGLLGLLNYNSMTGYEMVKEFDESLAYFWHATSQQIYKELDTMEKCGWLVSERIMQTEKPNKRVYSITPNGKKALVDWLSAPEEGVKKFMQGKNPFLMRLAFMGEADDDIALQMLYDFRNQYLTFANTLDGVNDMLAEEEANLGRKVMKYWKIVALHGEYIRKARLEWAEEAIVILENERDDSNEED
ncbi:MAG: PadR family transcriptional regulator [Oscillospiraceae bacterium]|nr:PadR family transcriptional regulator [Oscillospiraceae bacterium]